jgi:hypothetical protein
MKHNLDKSPPPVLLLTEQEAAVLDAALHVRFGELLNVEMGRGEPKITRQVAPAQAAFIQALRSEGLAHLDLVIVHNGLPQQIEIDGTFLNITYKRKLRFT